jgi:hypothetical protein
MCFNRNTFVTGHKKRDVCVNHCQGQLQAPQSVPVYANKLTPFVGECDIGTRDVTHVSFMQACLRYLVVCNSSP